ncbi:MAG TPA: carboxypeptidase-like regulatory domain-containing protein [Candidatus Paceibacterota bacterium]|nr:carboxypeptidase-like regulatory domain-containing protein [Candidatus Paceibacterota bacterium]
MHRTTRRIIFYICLCIFVAASYVVILYAQGYRYSFAESRFTRTGALDVKINTPAHVFIDGEDRGATSFLSNVGGVDGLVPGTYTVSVRKDGYSVWQKKVSIEEGFVQHFPHVLILPQTGQDAENVRQEITALLYPPTPSPTASASVSPSISAMPKPTATKKPTLSPSPTATPYPTTPFFIDKNTLYVQGQDQPQAIAQNISVAYLSDDHQKVMWISGGQIWVYWLSASDYQPFHEAGDIAMIASFKSPIKAVAWFRDSDHIVADIGTSVSPLYKVVELDTRGGLNTISY